MSSEFLMGGAVNMSAIGYEVQHKTGLVLATGTLSN
jgi:hypothetical protein